GQARGGRPDGAGGARVGPPALPAHPHDGLRVHPGCGAADARERVRLRRAERHGDCGVLGHAGRDVPWCVHHPWQLRLRGAARPLPTAVEASSGRAAGSDTARRASVSRTARGDEVEQPPDLEAVPASLTWDLTRILLAVVGIGDRADDVVAWSRSVISRPLPALPAWVTSLPIVGKKIAVEWTKIASAPSEEVAARLGPHVRDLVRWLIAEAGSIGSLLVQFLLTVAVSGVLYARGEAVAGGVLAFAQRLAGNHGVRAVLLSADAIRAVALGVVVTAVVQAVVGGIGLAVT